MVQMVETVSRPRPSRQGRSKCLELLAIPLLLGLSACSGAPPELGSIGVVLRRSTEAGELFVKEVPEPIPNGLQVNDEVLMVDGKHVAALSDAELKQSLRGPEGTSVTLTVIREAEVKRITIQRTRAAKR
jgi:C-terminal processing protease CtpA/Prc